LVERFLNTIKHCHRAAARCDKRAANGLAFVRLASIKLWLRVNPRPGFILLQHHLTQNRRSAILRI
jgi:hypothetical protein